MHALSGVVVSPAAQEMAKYGEYQEALDIYLRRAVRDQVPVPGWILERIRQISADLIPEGVLTTNHIPVA